MYHIYILQDLEKLTYIIGKIKINYSIKNLNKIKNHQILLETLPKINKEINTIQLLLKDLKSLIEIELKKYTGNCSLFILLH